MTTSSTNTESPRIAASKADQQLSYRIKVKKCVSFLLFIHNTEKKTVQFLFWFQFLFVTLFPSITLWIICFISKGHSHASFYTNFSLFLNYVNHANSDLLPHLHILFLIYQKGIVNTKKPFLNYDDLCYIFCIS